MTDSFWDIFVYSRKLPQWFPSVLGSKFENDVNRVEAYILVSLPNCSSVIKFDVVKIFESLICQGNSKDTSLCKNMDVWLICVKLGIER